MATLEDARELLEDVVFNSFVGASMNHETYAGEFIDMFDSLKKSDRKILAIEIGPHLIEEAKRRIGKGRELVERFPQSIARVAASLGEEEARMHAIEATRDCLDSALGMDDLRPFVDRLRKHGVEMSIEVPQIRIHRISQRCEYKIANFQL